ncbi:MAG: 1,4-dihydroxy-2-naphthoate polyprenyltransferase [Chloroflexia bacterium]|nr:1,4-dihydroxy-2-naphthoate polyprenyltransferase [Chloroflexia bacterium]
MTASATLSPPQIWLMAVRPKTLTAAVAPVITGTAVAVHKGGEHLPSAILAMLTALLLQIAANLANDAFDFRRGADTAELLGPARVTSSGLVGADTMIGVTIGVLALAILTGLPLAMRGGWPILALGIVAIVCAVAYTAGPFPLAYLGMGEVFVMLFFGFAAVAGTAFVQTGELTALALATSIPIGALAVGILVVNNLRDIETDRAAGKRTVAVRLGERRTRWEYAAMLIVAGAAPVVFWIVGWLNWSCVLTILERVSQRLTILAEDGRSKLRSPTKTVGVNHFAI